MDIPLNSKGRNLKRSQSNGEFNKAGVPRRSNRKCLGGTETALKREYVSIPLYKKKRGRKRTKQVLAEKNTNANADINQSLNSPPKFLCQEVIEAAVQCVIVQAHECEKSGLPLHQAEKIVIEEMGRCLEDILDSILSLKNVSLECN